MGLEVLLVPFTLLGLIFGIFLGYFRFNPFRWAKFKRQVLRRNYGIVNFISANGSIFPKIMNFSGDLFKLKNSMYILQNDFVYRIIKEEDSGTEKIEEIIDKAGNKRKVRLHTRIDETMVRYMEGIPIIFFDINNMLPRRIEGQKYDDTLASKNPIMVQTAIDKEREALKLEVLKSKWKDMKIFFIVIIMLVIVAIAVSAVTFQQVNNVGMLASNIQAALYNVTVIG